VLIYPAPAIIESRASFGFGGRNVSPGETVDPVSVCRGDRYAARMSEFQPRRYCFARSVVSTTTPGRPMVLESRFRRRSRQWTRGPGAGRVNGEDADMGGLMASIDLRCTRDGCWALACAIIVPVMGSWFAKTYC